MGHHGVVHEPAAGIAVAKRQRSPQREPLGHIDAGIEIQAENQVFRMGPQTAGLGDENCSEMPLSAAVIPTPTEPGTLIAERSWIAPTVGSRHPCDDDLPENAA